MRILLACEELRLSTFVVSPARTVRQGRDDRRLKTTGSREVPVPNYRCDLLCTFLINPPVVLYLTDAAEARCLICTADVAFQWVFHWKRTARRRLEGDLDMASFLSYLLRMFHYTSDEVLPLLGRSVIHLLCRVKLARIIVAFIPSTFRSFA